MIRLFSSLNKSNLPFTYIAAIPRSGSTLLSGMLTSKPHSLILSEPGLQRGYYHNTEQYKHFKIVNYPSLKEYELKPKKMVRHFSRNIVPEVYKNYEHLGVKECFHDNWELYSHYFEKVNYIILARDPRDILLSIYDYGSYDPKHKAKWMDQGVEYIARRLNQVWQQQKEILERERCFSIRYEDLCREPELFLSKIQAFLKIDSFLVTKPSSAIKRYPKRQWEVDKNNDQITSQSTYRWKTKQHKFSDDFHLITRLMSDYIDHWQYHVS